MPVEAFKYFGLISIGLFLIVTFYISLRWHEDNALTLSKHIARNKTPYLLFAITSIVGQSLFWLFMVFWYIPNFQLSYILGCIISIGSVGQITAAWIPDTGEGLGSKVHYIAACAMAITMYVFTIWVSLSPSFSGFPKYFSILSFALMTLFWGMFFTIKEARKNTFVYQNLYLLIFYSTVLVTAYIA